MKIGATNGKLQNSATVVFIYYIIYKNNKKLKFLFNREK